MAGPIIVLGIGNTLMRDDGVGVHAAEQLRRDWWLPESVQVIDGGTAGMELLDPLADAEVLIVLDAVRGGRSPGTLVHLDGDAVPKFFRQKLSPHQVSICDVLAGLEFAGHAPRELELIGVEPQDMSLGLELTAPVARQLPAVVEAAVQALVRRGLPVQPRNAAAAAPAATDPAATNPAATGLAA